VPIPEFATYSPVWPPEIPAGGPDTTLQISGTGFTLDSIVQVNGQDTPTEHIKGERIGGSYPLLRAMISQSWLREPRSLEIRVLNPYGGASLAIEIQLKAGRQPAEIESEFSKTTVRQKDQLEVAVRVTNQGNDSFLLPKKIEPFISDNSYQFETKRPSDVTFSDIPVAILDGISYESNPTEDQFINSGQAVLVAPGATYSDEVSFPVEKLRRVGTPLLPGQYMVRMSFNPRSVPGQDEFRSKFFGVSLLSNSVVLTVLQE
jgi:hypothetical protein